MKETVTVVKPVKETTTTTIEMPTPTVETTTTTVQPDNIHE